MTTTAKGGKGKLGKGKLDINRKVGPLPLWGWGALVVGGLYAWRYMHPAEGGDAAPGAIDESLASGGSGDVAPYYGSGAADNGGGGVGGYESPAPAEPAFSDPGDGGEPTGFTNNFSPSITNIVKVPKPRKRHHKPPPNPHHPHRPKTAGGGTRNRHRSTRHISSGRGAR